MKNYRLKFVLILLMNSSFMFGQINPINDLFYQQTYWFGNDNCPSWNCFELSWAIPDNSNDTLLGYNIYRNNVLWIFTQETNVTCSGYETCDFNDFYDPLPFWITVKAIYNSDSILSITNDSVYVNDLMINVGEIEKKEIAILKNPLSIGENVSILIPNPNGENCRIQVYSLNGQLIKEYQNKYVLNDIINFSTNKLTHGLYVINIQLNEKTITKKLIIK